MNSEKGRKINIFDLPPFNQPLRDRLIEQAESGLVHGVDILDLVRDPDYDFEKNNGYDPAHDRWHMRRVFSNAETLAGTTGADLDIVRAAAAFHDLITFKKEGSLRKHETDLSAEYIEHWLKELGFPEEKIPKVQQAIRESSFFRTFLQKPPESRIRASSIEAEAVFDADKLDQGGALGIIRYCSSSGRIGRELFNLEDPKCLHREPDPDKYGMDLCRERSLELEEKLYTEVGRNIARRRSGFLNEFLDKLCDEVNGRTKGDTQIIMEIFAQAGKQSIHFYHPEDPFAKLSQAGEKKRQLEPKKYAIDALLGNEFKSNSFVQEFLSELET